MVTELARRDLVDRDADPDVTTRGLVGVRTGEEAGRRTRMIAGTVAEGPGVAVTEAPQDREVTTVFRERLEAGRGVVRTFPLGSQPSGSTPLGM